VDTIWGNPAFRTYAICTAILVVKMIFSAVYTGSRRQAHQAYINSEDASVFGGDGVGSAEVEAPAVAHALRIERNDLANIPAFWAIGLVYVLAGASATGAAIYFWTFTIARIVHTVMYMNHMQPWRAVSFGVGALATLGMCVSVLIRAL